MDTSAFPKKKFVIGPMHNIVLSNIEENTKFLSTRINMLKTNRFGSTAFYQDLETVFAEFVSVYDYDKSTSMLPAPLGTFKFPDYKQLWIENHLLAIDFEYHLGGILYNYHDWLVDQGQLPDIVLGRMITDYPSVYKKVIYDYISVLKYMPPQYPFTLECVPLDEKARCEREKTIGHLQRNQLYGNEKPYFASFALPSLIEHYLIGFMQQDLVDKLMKDAQVKNKSGVISLSPDDKNYVDSFLTRTEYMDGSREEAMERCRDILKSAGLIPDASTEQIILGIQGRSPITLGQFLKNSYVIAHIKKPYYDVLEILFSTKKVNLRNSIMHGASTTFDPYAMCFSAVMLQLFWAIIDRNIFI